ncbi:MAG TPA: HEAT repeat domain-containing protein [Terracidiphilus sp.]|jgi:anti-sigma factor RsiW|nr:HEAT repeat domain-containing protein [Terracidiphilus sp.]
MNCELAHERIVTAAYGELPDDQVHELERHLGDCTACRKEREQVMALKVLADALPVVEPGANLVARSRLRLDEALDALPPMHWYERLAQRLMNSVAGLQAAPVAAALLLVAGIGAGSLGGFEFAQNRAAHAATAVPAVAAASVQPQPAAPVALTNIANVSSIVRQPGSEMVEVSYNQLVPGQIKGSLDDPAIRQLLMLASENSSSTGVRDDSVGLLAAECRAGHSCQAAGIRDALMVALRYDKNAGVREKALEGLEPYVAQDVRVRNAVLEALLDDNDPRIRTESINILEPVEGDTSVRQVLYSVSTSDDSPQIRNVSRQVLSRVPEIQ